MGVTRNDFFIDQCNTVYLKIFPKLQPPAPVLDHEVPLFIRDVHSLVTKDWDLSLQQVTRYVSLKN